MGKAAAAVLAVCNTLASFDKFDDNKLPPLKLELD